MREALREGTECTVVLRNYRKDGTLFYNELHVSPIVGDGGEITHFVGLQRDVTHLKETENRIKAQNEALRLSNEQLALARRKAEDATRLKSEFLATMSHELRTPLNAIIGYTEILLAGMAGEMNTEQRDYQERILVNAENLLQLINNLLDLSKIEAGRMDIVPKPFLVRDWLQEIVRQTQSLAHEKPWTFSTASTSACP
ncbi:MAG: PAS domain-containing protein [Anaerolineae bacterium]|nr:PAS domain-containing protein [Anaerolineae bacterium]